jgi:hypothetical protein
MKKVSTKSREPTAGSLREMPPIDFSRYRVRRNPYAVRIAREGAELVHDEPSPASLTEMPEADFSRARRNPYANRAAEAIGLLHYGKGRPRTGREVGPTPAKSIRLPEPVWKALEAEARARNTTLHALLRELIAAYVDRLCHEQRLTARRDR